MALAKLD
ncbi:Protein of unknown function [Bacillus wiedmannii]|nr:Protein of unknown function [Bacillus wiedmannii]